MQKRKKKHAATAAASAATRTLKMHEEETDYASCASVQSHYGFCIANKYVDFTWPGTISTHR